MDAENLSTLQTNLWNANIVQHQEDLERLNYVPSDLPWVSTFPASNTGLSSDRIRGINRSKQS